MGVSVCNKDCFNCIYDDCILDGMDAEDYAEASRRDEMLMTPEKKAIREQNRAQYLRNIDKRREYARAYYWAHREKYMEYARKYYADNRDRLIVKQREYYHANADEINARTKEARMKKKMKNS